MPERDDDNPLAGADATRPLPDAVLARLHDALVAEAGGGRPLDPSLSARLEDALTNPLGTAPVDGPRPLPPATRARLEDALLRRSGRRRAVAAAAAVVTLAGAGVGVGVWPGGRQAAAPRPADSRPAIAPRPGAAPGSGGTTPPATSQSGAGVVNPASPGVALPSATGDFAPVTSVSPVQGPTSGDNWITLQGPSFAGVTSVEIGGTPAPYMVGKGGRSLRALAPAHAPGRVAVVVIVAPGAFVATAAGREGDVTTSATYTYGP